MDVIFQGRLDGNEAAETLASVIRLFKERYHIDQFREMHLSLTLVDEQGEDVELVDSETKEAYRIFEVQRHGYAFKKESVGRPLLKLIVDNTR